jgi:BirA family biotin operon repressor/biotin-[acetyl-CoA-carboxylase] ligase
MSREAVLSLLEDGAWHSGPALADALGVGRGQIGKYIQQLRGQGWLISAQHGVGYRLEQRPDWLDAAALQAACPWPLRVVRDTGSTNQDLLDQHQPQVLLSERQSQGRGRRGKVWQSPLGCNVYLSIGYRFETFPQQIGTLPLMMGVACAEALRPWADLRLKWPNDLWLGQQKVGGLLIESRGEIGGALWVVVGVGVNVNLPDVDLGIDQPYASLQGSRTDIAAALIAALLPALQGFRGLDQSRWQPLDALYGRSIRTSEGWIGTACGVNPDGSLRLRTDEGEMAVTSEVSVRVQP